MKSDYPVNIENMKSVDLIEGEDADETKLLKEMAKEARDFLCSHKWCERVDDQHLAFGVGGVVAVFLVQITPAATNVDPYLWVVVGNLPPAYMVIDGSPTGADALDGYCSLMEEWVEAVKNGESIDDLIPVNVPPTREWADQLSGRLDFLKSKILPLACADGQNLRDESGA